MIIKSAKYGYILDTTDLIRECCITYYKDIANVQPENTLNHTEAILINQSLIYIFREKPIKIFNGSQEATQAYFKPILEGFDFMLKIREIVYKLDHGPFY